MSAPLRRLLAAQSRYLAEAWQRSASLPPEDWLLEVKREAETEMALYDALPRKERGFAKRYGRIW